MDQNGIIKKLYLDEDLNPIVQKNRGGDIIHYYAQKGNVKYCLTYNYFMR